MGFELSLNPILSIKAETVSSSDLTVSLWASGISAFDLRFVKTASMQEVKVYLLCRIRAAINDRDGLYKYCSGAAKHIQQIFQAHGYTLQLLMQDDALLFARRPFHFQTIAEIRRREEEHVFSGGYANTEFYVTYPWEWYCATALPYLDALLRQQGNWLVSIYLEPTRLNTLEERLLDFVTSSDVRDRLLEGGRSGEKIYEIYTVFAERLEHPYLLRISLAAASQQTLAQMSQSFLRQWQNRVPGPVLHYARHPYEQQAAERNLSNLEWIPWGNIRDHQSPSARLRYLTDSKGASVVFNLPSSRVEKLKVLIVFANPRSTTPLRLQQEERLIKEAIRSSRYRDNIETPTILPAATINDLSRALLEDQFHIVHIAGHGNMGGLLVLEDENGNKAPVPQEPLANLFKRYKATIRCVLLSACRGLDQGKRISFGIPYTIAMEGELDDNAALAFSRGFYEALGAGHEIESAYEEGCSRVSLTAYGANFVSQIFSPMK